MTTTAGAPASAPAQATACAWFPAETVTSPLARSEADRLKTLFKAPRGLKDPVFCKHSHLRKTEAPRRSPMVREDSIGVRCTLPAIRAAASRICPSSIKTFLLEPEILLREPVHGCLLSVNQHR